MKKKALVLILMFLLVPATSFAATNTMDAYITSLNQVIALLLQEVQMLKFQLAAQTTTSTPATTKSAATTTVAATATTTVSAGAVAPAQPQTVPQVVYVPTTNSATTTPTPTPTPKKPSGVFACKFAVAASSTLDWFTPTHIPNYVASTSPGMTATCAEFDTVAQAKQAKEYFLKPTGDVIQYFIKHLKEKTIPTLI